MPPVSPLNPPPPLLNPRINTPHGCLMGPIVFNMCLFPDPSACEPNFVPIGPDVWPLFKGVQIPVGHIGLFFLAHYPFYMNMHVCAKFDSDRITGDRPRVYAWNDTDTRTHSRTHARTHAHTHSHILSYIYI